MLYILPIFLDYLVGFQDHGRYGFWLAMPDVPTACIYDVGLIIASFIILFTKIPNKGLFYENLQTKPLDDKKSITLWLILGMALPAFFTVFLLRQPELLYSFQWRELELFPISGSYSNVEKLTYFGISCAVMLLTDRRGKVISLSRILALLFLFVNVCIQGKRGILFFAIINIIVNLFLIYVSLGRNKKSRKVFAVGAVVVTAALTAYMIFMSFFVKIERGYNEDDTVVLYTSTRVDFFRDDRVRMAIYSEIHPDKMTILSHKGETIIPNILSIVPLNYIADWMGIEIHSYQQFLSSANDGVKFKYSPKAENLNHMTPTIYAELISNFGILIGFLLFPLLCVWFANVIDKYGFPHNSFLICTFILVNLFNLPYLMMYAEIVLIICIISKRKSRQEMIKRSRHESINDRAVTC